MDPSADATPGFIDIVRLDIGADQTSVTLSMSVAAAVPAGTPLVGQLAYRFYLDIDGDGGWDKMAALESVAGGGFVPVLVDRPTGDRLEGARFPGTANLTGRRISLTVPLGALGCPSVIGVRGAAEQTKGGSSLRDDVPDVSDAWTRIDTGCQTP